MIRPAIPEDTEALLAMTAATGVFKPFEVDTLREVLDSYHEYNRETGDRCFVIESDGEALGFEYHSLEPMTDRSWMLWWIVVRPDKHGRGLGRQLMAFMEEDAIKAGARVMFLETSSLPSYEPTRQFYLSVGYEITGQIRDYYAAGDDMVMFRKPLQG
ncbi:GNAT family N-acetyltransferase [Zavarzinella formosa]|uniref:GNAT family N-acetyltransferase n=1 Tax=Zavarzinella formosa TaxID=360055 RepID=UPI0002E42E23|nr:GNAT family N-acetyltransferase [Zavarzinella formosa]